MKLSGCMWDVNIQNNKGGVAVQAVLALLTLLIIAGLIFFVLSKDREKQQVYHRKVIAIAEYGLQGALQKLYEDPHWSGTSDKVSYDDGWYNIKVRRFTKSDTVFLSVISEGHIKSISDSQKCVLARDVINGDSVWVRRSP